MMNRPVFRGGASITALGLAIALPAHAQNVQPSDRGTPAAVSTANDPSDAPQSAQDAQPQPEDIVVTGVRASLKGAQQIKRNAAQVVDSIVAEDIGKLPDNTVSDALQRVTGIQVSRAAGEVGTVLVRGLPDIETLINGREIFTGTGRGVALQDIPAELVAGVDVYKTNLPSQIEGSVSGTIDIRLRRPFDFDGLQIAGGARGIYSDKRDKWSYIGSGLVSDRWQTGIGEIGILIAGSYNKRRYQDQTAFNFGFNPLSAANPTLIPDTVGGLVTDGDRTRQSVNVALQWRPSPNLEFYADGLYTGYRQDYDVDFFVGLPKAGDVTVNTVQDGSAASAETGNRPVARTITTRNNFTITSKQTFHQTTDGYQANLGGKWTTGPAVLSGEFTYNKSDVTSRQYVVDTAFVVPRIDYDFDAGRTPRVNFNGYDVTDRTKLNFLTLFDNRNLAASEQYAWHGDLLYNVDGGFLKNFAIGARYARRTGSSAGTNPSGYPIPFVSANGYPGATTNAPDDILGGRLGVDRFALASSDWIRANIGTVRGLANRPAGDPPFDPAQTFSLRERVFAYYGQAAFGFDAGSMPVEGTIGVRAVNTATDLNAIQVTNSATGTTLSPITGKRNQLDLLPTLTLKIRPTDQIVLRAVAGKAILRPQFAQLNPAISLTQNGQTGNQGFFGTGGGGNADLRNVESKNLDLTAEWYFSNTGSFTIAGFYKELDGYIQSYAALEPTIASNGTVQQFLITRPRNTQNGRLKGVEVSYTQFYDFLPGPLGGLGAQASFTYSDGQVDDPLNIGKRQEITPVSKYSYNLVAIYEKYGFSARLAYNWRSKYIDSYSQALAGGKIVVSPVKFLDFSASYAVNNVITLTVDATNLLNETYHDNFGTTGFEPRDTRQYDRTFGGGVRFKF
ncbi:MULTISPECIES: TonB-dependent receptor [unclassified Sphingomonas]|jgi:iron complex outermembrane recepter protein|uniref:TonB-dependent receptor n=1 Tax=unclassified Sphingomonas TaxID=196159 RepID=UPI0026D7D5CE|nr:TonB-dependent receptor [Sphingomonas sp.]